MFNWRLFGITIGFVVNAEGQIGVMMKADRLGCMIGPPADREWPVEPVVVATITPSALNRIIFRWSIVTESSISRAKFP